MQPVWLCIYWGKQVKETYENPQWRKDKQMQPMWLCILSGRRFEETFENAQWRKAKQMQPMRLCILWSKQFEETFENAQRRKVKQMLPTQFFNHQFHLFVDSFEITQCSGGKLKNAINFNFALMRFPNSFNIDYVKNFASSGILWRKIADISNIQIFLQICT